jgi:hypothetical protein
LNAQCQIGAMSYQVHLKKIGRLSGCLREQARSHNESAYTCKRLVGCQAVFAGKPRSHSESAYTCKRLVGCQAVFAGKPRSYKWVGVCLREIAWL